MSVQLDLDHAKHYALELRDPVFLVHADVQANEVFWYAPQLDNDLIQKLNVGENVSTVTVRVPTSNALPTTAAKLLETLELTYVVLGHRTLVASTMSSFANSLPQKYVRFYRDTFLDLKIQDSSSRDMRARSRPLIISSRSLIEQILLKEVMVITGRSRQ